MIKYVFIIIIKSLHIHVFKLPAIEEVLSMVVSDCCHVYLCVKILDIDRHFQARPRHYVIF